MSKRQVLPAITHHKKRAFLAAYGRIGNVTSAAILAEITPHTHRNWLAADEDYATAFAAAKEEAADWLETEAHRRAFLGVLKPVHYKGERVDYLREYSDTLLIFLLKGVRPDKYRERIEHSGNEDSPIRVTVGPRKEDHN